VTTQTVQTAGVAAMPRVNLMPPEIAEAERFRRLQAVMVLAVLVAVAIVAGLYMHARSGVSAAKQQLSLAQAQHDSLQTKLNGLSQVSATYDAVRSKQALLQQAMGQEIRWSYVLNDLSFRVPVNVWLTNVSATESTAPGATTSSSSSSTTPLPGAPSATIGAIEFDGVAMKHDNVAAWLDALAKEKGFTQPTFSGSTESVIGSRGVTNFKSSVLLDPAALSNRYVTKAGS
jgi:Tfp pilus assembly protein PilN